MSKIKIAFVTGYIGESPTNIPNITKDVDSYFLTNNQNIYDDLIKKNIFTKVIKINDVPVIDSSESVDNYIKNSMDSKRLKVFPQTFLESKYDFVIWYDNKFSVNINDTIKVINSWNKKHALMLRRHTFVANVEEEFKECILQPRYEYQKKNYIKFINKCKKRGLKDNYKIHSVTNYIIYNLNHDMTTKIQKIWNENIEKCGIQCQISFNLIRQNYEKYIGEFKYYHKAGKLKTSKREREFKKRMNF